MNEQLVVKNFGPIKDATVDFKRVTVFIGPTGGGKSTLAKLAAVFREYISFLSKSEVNKLFSRYGIKTYFDERSNIDWTAFPGRIIYSDDKWKNAFHKVIQHERDEARVLITEVSKELSLLKELLNEGQTDSDYRVRVDELRRKQVNVETFIKKYAAPNSPHYIPAERILLSTLGSSWPDLISEKVNLPDTLLLFAKQFLKARDDIQDLTLPEVGVRYRFDNGNDRIILQNDKVVLLSETASGIQSVTPLLVLLEHLSRNTEQAQSFIIEEPELNLYPTAQQGLLNWLVEKCTKGENDLTITTHSPYILSHLNLLLYAYQVAEQYPERREQVAAIVPESSWINPKEFACYQVENGGVQSLVDDDLGLIDNNELDALSGDAADAFDNLIRLSKAVAIK